MREINLILTPTQKTAAPLSGSMQQVQATQKLNKEKTI